MLAEVPKFFGYIRVSGKSQIAGDGPERQSQTITGFCREQKFELICHVREDGVSGTMDGMDRPKFADLIDDIEFRRQQGQRVDGIIVERMDRLARDLMVSEMILRECRERGIKVLCADRGIENVAEEEKDPTRTLIRQVLGALAQWEKSALVMKLRKARERKKQTTGRCEGQKPMGKNRNEQQILQFFKMSVLSGYSFDRTAEELNAAGFRNRKGGMWNAAAVDTALRTMRKRGQL